MGGLKGKGAITIGGKGNIGREVDDFYATQPSTVKELLDVFNLDGCNSFLEPACGMGHISKVLKEYYSKKEIVSTDLVDRGYEFAQTPVDFLSYDYGRTFDVILTNPPFSLAKEFVEKGLEISDKYVIMLLKSQFLESSKRKDFLIHSPLHYVYVFSNRQSTWKGGTPINPVNGKPWSTTLMMCWYVWEKGYTGEPILRWL